MAEVLIPDKDLGEIHMGDYLKEIEIEKETADSLLNEKRLAINVLLTLKKSYIKAKTAYKNKYNDSMLNTDWSTLDGKVTDAVKKSYCERNSSVEKQLMLEYEADIEICTHRIDLLDVMIDWKMITDL